MWRWRSLAFIRCQSIKMITLTIGPSLKYPWPSKHGSANLPVFYIRIFYGDKTPQPRSSLSKSPHCVHPLGPAASPGDWYGMEVALSVFDPQFLPDLGEISLGSLLLTSRTCVPLLFSIRIPGFFFSVGLDFYRIQEMHLTSACAVCSVKIPESR